MALIHYVHKNIENAFPKEGFMFNFKIMKFKMKLAYECWTKKMRLNELIWRAIFKSLVQRQNIAANELQIFLQRQYNY